MSKHQCNPEDLKQLNAFISLRQLDAIKETLHYSIGCLHVSDKYGGFLVTNAAKSNDAAMVKYLVSNGANPFVKDGFGNTVESWANLNHNRELIQFVKSIKHNSLDQL